MYSEDNQHEYQPQPVQPDAIDLEIEYSPQRQSLLWQVLYGGDLSCWSERSLQEAVGGLALVHMESEDLNTYSITEYGINFNGFNYSTQNDLGEAVLIYLSDMGYRFSAQTLGEPSLILCGLRDNDQAPETQPNQQLQAKPCQTQPNDDTQPERTTDIKTLWRCFLAIARNSKH